ncbi:MAG: thioredoxin [Leeuwenhoekiella sp.]|uniref:Thioredoxin n=1 Tax=Leeuwenhoekiella nanhaiensis TaxID=1655491 RepID=A0A2G1VS89_9FLAO|nr:thioredoxin [Leeuwenhoekiella nanhaiensis]PHQ29319.1 thioredoxin [Leeuwenhoekiella nanhaiensis]PHR93526.1 MAG: thioredoxin [Leeuwenhoekiella sp.]
MKTSFGTLTDSDIPVLIDFYATWCGPCQTLAPILQDVKKDLGEKVKIVKIDVDKNPAIAQKFQVRGVPTLMLFKNGKQLWRQSGVLSRADLKQVVAQHSR